MNLVIKLRSPDTSWNKHLPLLQHYADVSVVYDDAPISKLQNTEVLITTSINSDMLANMPHLKAIFVPKTGLDRFPLDEIKTRKILLVNTHVNSQIIAEHALALALALLHRTCEFHKDLCNGMWYGNGIDYKWHSLQDMRVGIVGYGHIGKNIDRLIENLCKEVLILDRGKERVLNKIPVSSFEELLQRSDLLFLALPEKPDTINLINEFNIPILQGKYLVNIGRASVCDEESLYYGLEKKILAGYASDVWFCEPNKMNRTQKRFPSRFPFHELPNVILSPHCATHEINAHERYIEDTIKNCLSYLSSLSNGAL